MIRNIIYKLTPSKLIEYYKNTSSYKIRKENEIKEQRLNKLNCQIDQFNQLGQPFDIKIDRTHLKPIFDEDTQNTSFDAHYIYHPAWAARIVKRINPNVHVDISSTLHFCSILSAFVPVKFYDYRPALLNLDNLDSGHCNLTELAFESNSIECLSCMHTVEHIGLGRYGDAIDPIGDQKAIKELKRVVRPGGDLLFVVPVGKERIEFNAHRIYNPQTIINQFESFELKELAVVMDNSDFVTNPPLEDVCAQSYACGCFWFKKNEDK